MTNDDIKTILHGGIALAIFVTLCAKIGPTNWQIELSFFLVFVVTFLVRKQRKNLSESIATVACVFASIIYAIALLPSEDDARHGFLINIPGAIILFLTLCYLATAAIGNRSASREKRE